MDIDQGSSCSALHVSIAIVVSSVEPSSKVARPSGKVVLHRQVTVNDLGLISAGEDRKLVSIGRSHFGSSGCRVSMPVRLASGLGDDGVAPRSKGERSSLLPGPYLPWRTNSDSSAHSCTIVGLGGPVFISGASLVPGCLGGPTADDRGAGDGSPVRSEYRPDDAGMVVPGGSLAFGRCFKEMQSSMHCVLRLRGGGADSVGSSGDSSSGIEVSSCCSEGYAEHDSCLDSDVVGCRAVAVGPHCGVFLGARRGTGPPHRRQLVNGGWCSLDDDGGSMAGRRSPVERRPVHDACACVEPAVA